MSDDHTHLHLIKGFRDGHGPSIDVIQAADRIAALTAALEEIAGAEDGQLWAVRQIALASLASVPEGGTDE